MNNLSEDEDNTGSQDRVDIDDLVVSVICSYYLFNIPECVGHTE